MSCVVFAEGYSNLPLPPNRKSSANSATLHTNVSVLGTSHTRSSECLPPIVRQIVGLLTCGRLKSCLLSHFSLQNWYQFPRLQLNILFTRFKVYSYLFSHYQD